VAHAYISQVHISQSTAACGFVIVQQAHSAPPQITHYMQQGAGGVAQHDRWRMHRVIHRPPVQHDRVAHAYINSHKLAGGFPPAAHASQVYQPAPKIAQQ
jgi:hypothetical protein